jgi:hypothetical protein
MKKVILLVPLCLCVVAVLVMSGCGSSDILDLPPTIRDLTIITPESRTGDINFSFEYYDNEDQTVDFTIEYSLDGTNWLDATVLNTDSGSYATLTNRAPDDYNLWWDANGDKASGSNCFLRVVPGNGLLKIEDVVGPFTVGTL